MAIYEENNIYEQVDPVNNFKNDDCSEFTRSSGSTSDVSQASSENYYPSMNTITNQTIVNINKQDGKIQIGDKYHIHARNGLKCKMTMWILIIFGMLLVMLLIWAEHNDPLKGVQPKPSVVKISYYNNYTNKCYVDIVNRKEWKADPFVGNERCLTEEPANHLIVTQTGTDVCTKDEICKKLVKKLQEHHLHTRKWNDIGYNFLIDSTGKIYEGLGFNQTCIEIKFDGICIAFIGTFNTKPPTSEAIDALKNLILYGRGYKNLNEYKLYAHPRLQTTNKIYEKIQKMINFTEQRDFLSDNSRRQLNCVIQSQLVLS